MSEPLARRSLVLLAFGLGVAAVAPACGKDLIVCTPDNSGFGDQRRLVRRDLPGLDPKKDCSPHIEVLRTPAELQAAYERVGVHIITPGTTPPADAIELPAVDFARESVVLREELHSQPVSWMVGSGTTVTIGSQGCTTQGDQPCGVLVFAVDAVATKADAYTCEAIGCAGGVGGGGE